MPVHLSAGSFPRLRQGSNKRPVSYIGIVGGAGPFRQRIKRVYVVPQRNLIWLCRRYACNVHMAEPTDELFDRVFTPHFNGDTQKINPYYS